jgi:hypothetical protein
VINNTIVSQITSYCAMNPKAIWCFKKYQNNGVLRNGYILFSYNYDISFGISELFYFYIHTKEHLIQKQNRMHLVSLQYFQTHQLIR